MPCRQRSLRAWVVTLIVALGASLFGGVTWLALGAADAPVDAVRPVAASGTPDAAPASLKARVAPEVQRRIARSTDDGLLRVIVMLRSEPPRPPQSDARRTSETSVAQRTRFVQDQQVRFYEAKSDLTPVLAEARRVGTLIAERDLWLVNAVALTADVSVVRTLMASPAVAAVRLDHYVHYLEPATSFITTSEVAAEARASGIPWGLTAVGAPRVWQTFAVTGTGAVVAVMDTGVDWQHPDLIQGYRGNMGKSVFDHPIAWHDAVNGGTYPYDDHGHGTHVVGTAVGASTGVAPGARWMGVKVLNSDGYGYDSWILSGFQWLLAPDGDASRAPDLVNASWSSNDSRSQVFWEAIQALEQAGIIAAFAVGNAGPQAQSVGSPASNPGVIAVGASDPDGEVAPFSGRGPSPWDEIKPLVVAPGVNVLSTAPGGIYLTKSGTSMATPHLVGLGALMRSVSPTLSTASMVRVITQTARPLTLTAPNNDSGWGEIDAYRAVLTLVDPAFLVGEVTARPDPGHAAQSISGATVTAWPDTASPGVDPGVESVTNDEGRYRMALIPGRYTVCVRAFGYQAQTVSRVDVTRDAPRKLDLALAPMPTGSVRGRVVVGGADQPPTSAIQVRALGTPVFEPVVEGAYALSLPEGPYTLEVRGLGYRVMTATVAVIADAVIEQDFALTVAPALLLVDEGAWYYGSEITYWRTSLDALQYVYDAVRIKDPGGVPISLTSLAPYDIVLWSSPSGSPGLVGASSVLSTYLATGGRLFLSGQDVAYFDGGATLLGMPSPYFADRLGAQFVADSSETRTVTGTGPFMGLHLDLQGGTGADNQSSPDVVAVGNPELASLAWSYGGGAGAGVAADTCVPYRALFLAFGFEGIADAADRHTVLGRGIDWLSAAPPTAGLTVSPVTAPTLIGLPGEQITHVMKVRHTGYAGVEERVYLTTSGSRWATELSDPTFRLAPCTAALVTVTVAIPQDVGVNAEDVVRISAVSDRISEPIHAEVRTKTPASVLLVDDDRWYPMEAAYKEALDAMGIVYDLWDTRSGRGGTAAMTSPSIETLSHYPIVVWFTGYDWYAPIEAVEAARLLAYLDGGGRLLLSSQDVVYHHQDDGFSERLGVMLADWADQAKEAVGVLQHPAGQAWAPEALTYPFPNWSHTVEPLPSASVVVRGQDGQPIGVATGAPDVSGAQTLFYAFPLEALSLPARSRALANGIGWLSPLGASVWRVSPSTAVTGTRVSFELALHNTADAPLFVEVAHYVSAAFDVQADALPPAVTYDPASRMLTWGGMVSAAASVDLSWDAIWVDGEDWERPTITLSLPAWDIAFVREAPFFGDGLDLTASRWRPNARSSVRTMEPLTLTYTVINDSAHGPEAVDVSFWLMTGLGPITATDSLTQGMALAGWRGRLGPFAGQDITLSVKGGAWGHPVRIDALLTTATGGRWEDALWLNFDPWRSYMPVVWSPD